MKDVRMIGENIYMRDINSTLQKHKECIAAASLVEKDILSNNSVVENASSDFHTAEFVNFTKTGNVNRECDGLRRQKRKQENVNMQGFSFKSADSRQMALNQNSEDAAEVQKSPQEAVERERRNLEGDAAVMSLVCDSLQSLKRCKRKTEVSPIQEVGIDTNKIADRALDDKLGLFDAKLNSGTAFGFKGALSSIGQWREKEGTGVVMDAKERGLTAVCDEALETPIAASSASRSNLGLLMSLVLNDLGGTINAAPTDNPQSCGLDKMRTSLRNDYEHGGSGTAKVNQVSLIDQTESQKLRAALAALQSQYNALLRLAEKGSRNCGHCQSIKEAIQKSLLNFADVPASPVSAGKVIEFEQNLSCEEAQEWSSPVGSCTSGKTGLSSDSCKQQIPSVSYALQMESPFLPKDMGFFVQERNNMHEDLEEGECHICIDLALSQSEDLDAEQLNEDLDAEQMNEDSQGMSLEREKITATERECVLESLLIQRERSKKIEDKGGCEELSDKSSQKGGCWNSTLTRNSWGLQGGDVINETEDEGYIDLKCGCTSQKHGDTMGILRLHLNGKVEIQCQCCLGCMKGKPMSPASFERHGGRGASKKWKDTIWIILGDQKVQFSKVKGLDAFVRRYKEISRGRLRQSASSKLPYHRDEFLQCKKCSKRRRFRRKTKEECWLFHEASVNSKWECSNYPYDSVLGCQDDEEREARQANRGCVRSRSCEGCIECVCLGCFTCRFEDCSCRLCVEYILNNK